MLNPRVGGAAVCCCCCSSFPPAALALAAWKPPVKIRPSLAANR